MSRSETEQQGRNHHNTIALLMRFIRNSTQRQQEYFWQELCRSERQEEQEEEQQEEEQQVEQTAPSNLAQFRNKLISLRDENHEELERLKDLFLGQPHTASIETRAHGVFAQIAESMLNLFTYLQSTMRRIFNPNSDLIDSEVQNLKSAKIYLDFQSNIVDKAFKRKSNREILEICQETQASFKTADSKEEQAAILQQGERRVQRQLAKVSKHLEQSHQADQAAKLNRAVIKKVSHLISLGHNTDLAIVDQYVLLPLFRGVNISDIQLEELDDNKHKLAEKVLKAVKGKISESDSNTPMPSQETIKQWAIEQKYQSIKNSEATYHLGCEKLFDGVENSREAQYEFLRCNDIQRMRAIQNNILPDSKFVSYLSPTLLKRVFDIRTIIEKEQLEQDRGDIINRVITNDSPMSVEILALETLKAKGSKYLEQTAAEKAKQIYKMEQEFIALIHDSDEQIMQARTSFHALESIMTEDNNAPPILANSIKSWHKAHEQMLKLRAEIYWDMGGVVTEIKTNSSQEESSVESLAEKAKKAGFDTKNAAALLQAAKSKINELYEISRKTQQAQQRMQQSLSAHTNNQRIPTPQLTAGD